MFFILKENRFRGLGSGDTQSLEKAYHNRALEERRSLNQRTSFQRFSTSWLNSFSQCLLQGQSSKSNPWHLYTSSDIMKKCQDLDVNQSHTFTTLVWHSTSWASLRTKPLGAKWKWVTYLYIQVFLVLIHRCSPTGAPVMTCYYQYQWLPVRCSKY